MILGICQLYCDVIGYEESDKCELGTLYTLKKKDHDVLILDWLHVRKQELLMSEVLLSLVTSTLQPPIGPCTFVCKDFSEKGARQLLSCLQLPIPQ